ncbi:hypothetical protein [Nocardia sp. alder85J]|uniref:hypothetical protein n=1 Tax=Nocardia sp. alder85J TaxID=2862949 RepID=UPI001CD511BE|nr:hypothetical protein [Nocardia sp. alder85J]MCX4096986.1 hypothetical protein [Nocardia sp. alder85J]
MDHHQHHGDDSANISSDPGGPDGPELRGRGGGSGRHNGVVDVGLLRPARRALGHPRVSTITLILLWIAVFVLYLVVHPG